MHDSTSIATDNRLTNGTIEISVQGKWRQVPALYAQGQTFVVTGRLIKIATLHNEQWAETEIVNPEDCVEEITKQRQDVHTDILSFTQKVPSITPRYKYSFEPESIAVAQIGSFQGWWEGLPQESRKNVRRSQKRGVTICQKEFGDELIRGIAEIQNESPIRQGRKYPHYGKTLEEVRKDHSDFIERSDFICACFEGRIIGFLKLVYRGGIASILQLNSMAAHYDKRPSNALIARAVQLCEAKGIEYLTYGKFNYGNKGKSSLSEFKMRNGFTEMLVPRYYVPLSAWGVICIRMRLYRGLQDVLPQSVIAAFVTARAKWYNIVRCT
jgi:hypothetical protein